MYTVFNRTTFFMTHQLLFIAFGGWHQGGGQTMVPGPAITHGAGAPCTEYVMYVAHKLRFLW